jgi:hypothetical protein
MIIANTNQFDKALLVSLTAYSGRLDRAGRPYILHPLRIAGKFPDNEDWAVIALLHDVVEDTFDTYCQITLPDIQAEFGQYIATQVGALTRRRPGMLYRSFDLNARGAIEWKIATEWEAYLQDYIPRVCQFSASREIKIQDLYDNLGPQRLCSLRTDEGRDRDHQALEILLARPTRTWTESLDRKEHCQQAGLIEERYSESTLAVGKWGLDL